MKKKIFTLLLAVAAGVGTMFASVTINGLNYDLNKTEKTAKVAQSSSVSGDLVIPSSVTYNSVTYSVTSIGSSAFAFCYGLTSVTIGNSVTSIGEDAFSHCYGLTSVTIGNSVTSIGWTAFNGCSGLTSVTIGNSVTSIGSSAFSGCSSLTSVTINSNAIVGKGYSEYSTIGSIFGSQVTEYIIGDEVTSIGEYAFYKCSGLTSVTIPNSVTIIGEYAFWGCSSLTSVTIPNSVTSIGDRAFYGCSSLTGELVIPNSVTSIGNYAFCNCSSLTSVTIGNSVTSIGSSAFWSCTGLTSVTIEAGTPPTLGSYAFSNTNNRPIYVLCGTIDAYKTAWTDYASRISYAPLPYKISTQAVYGSVGITSLENYTICDEQPYHYTLTVTANYGYHFVQWSDGNTDNPRTIVVTQDTTFTAEFAKNTYTISTASSNPEWGTTAGDTKALYLDEVEVSATPNYGYHFVRWDDNNTSNPRTVTITEDKTFTATFAKNVYSITANAEHGSILGNSSAEYLDYVTLTVTPDYGYHFTQWGDGNTDNPRTIVLTQDTILTAIIVMDTTGTCGKDYALTWSYSPTSETLTISGNGSFDENMECGVVAKQEMTKLVINEGVTAIGNEAFSNCENLTTMQLPTTLKTIGERAFYNCLDLVAIYNYRVNPCLIKSNTFENVNTFDCVLYVLASSIAKYSSEASGWKIFFDIKPIDATTVDNQVTDVTVVPSDNNAIVTWPVSATAETYTLQITKDGVVFCTLIFNGNGQLTGIAFAPGKNGNRHAPAAKMTANGLQFTVTGLNSATHYALTLQAKDDQDAVLASYSSEFTTTGTATGVDNTPFPSGEGRGEASKILRDGQLYILRGDKTYTVSGQEVK